MIKPPKITKWAIVKPYFLLISDPQLMTAVLANSQNSEHICPICNAKYNNVGNFKQHMKSHDTEQFREQRNAILSEMIATSYSKDLNQLWVTDYLTKK